MVVTADLHADDGKSSARAQANVTAITASALATHTAPHYSTQSLGYLSCTAC